MSGKRKVAVGQAVIPVERITRAILLIRGQKAMLDEALATLYEVEVKVLNQAVRRNADRFPADFMFQLTTEETALLRSQFGDGLRFSVERMTVADHGRPQANEGCRPEQYGCRVRLSCPRGAMWLQYVPTLRGNIP